FIPCHCSSRRASWPVRHTSLHSKHNHQFGYPHHTFLCKTSTGLCPLGGSVSPGSTNPAVSGLIPRRTVSFGANWLATSSTGLSGAPQFCCKPLLPCNGRGNNGLFGWCAFVLRLCA